MPQGCQTQHDSAVRQMNVKGKQRVMIWRCYLDLSHVSGQHCFRPKESNVSVHKTYNSCGINNTNYLDYLELG